MLHTKMHSWSSPFCVALTPTLFFADPPPIKEEVPYDPRTLYERLQEQKQKKDDAFAEATKFGKNLTRLFHIGIYSHVSKKKD